jgi:hypothetical protein
LFGRVSAARQPQELTLLIASVSLLDKYFIDASKRVGFFDVHFLAPLHRFLLSLVWGIFSSLWRKAEAKDESDSRSAAFFAA